MVARPSGSASPCWRPLSVFVLFMAGVAATYGSASAQVVTIAQSGGFGLSALFSTAKKPAETDRRTRLKINLRRQSAFEIFTLRNPNRVIIELPQVGMVLPRVRRNTNSLVRQLRAGRTGSGKSRIVIDVTEPVVVEKSSIVPAQGNRASLELVLIPFSSTSKRTRAALRKRPVYSLGGPSVRKAPPLAGSRIRQRNVYKPLIVIDPGHGGKDSGARKYGVNEKDVVLAFGLTLRKRLRATGRYRLIMTRDRDEFISLGKRRKIAEDNNAALFIAVHADYAGSRARGATIYSLRRGVARRLRAAAAARAAREVRSGGALKYASARGADLKAVQGILGDLAQREVRANLERTNVFTEIAIKHMGASTTMRSKPHREAAFKVIKTAKVPSVLIELAYVSNRQDSKRLQSQRWRDRVSSSLVTAIDKYFARSVSQIAQ